MTKIVTFTDLATPTALAGVAVAGGSLAANTTYYYIVQAVFDNGTYNSFAAGKSYSSLEIAVSTNATNRSITLTWNHPKGAGGGYRIVRRAGASAKTGQHTVVNKDLRDTTINSAGVCTWTDDGSTTDIGNYIYQNTSHGILVLTSTDSVNDVWSIVDLYNADVAGGWGVVNKLDESTYRVDAYVSINYAGAKWLDLDKTIIFADGFFTGGTGSTFTFGAFNAGNGVTSRGCRLIYKTYWLTNSSFPILYAYKTTFDWVGDYHPYYTTDSGLLPVGIYFASGIARDCMSNKMRKFVPTSAANCTLKNFVCTQADIAFNTGQATFDNVTGMYCSRLFQTSGSTTMTAKNAINTASMYTILVVGQNNNITMINSNVTPASYAPLGNCKGTVVYEKFTYNLTVNQNVSATPISGASVKIYDAFNNLICDTTTNASGVIAEQTLIFRTQTYSDASTSVRTSTNYAPHKMVVSAPGFEIYTQFTNYTGAYATQHIVGLTRLNNIRQTIEGDLLLALKPELGSSSKLLKL